MRAHARVPRSVRRQAASSASTPRYRSSLPLVSDTNVVRLPVERRENAEGNRVPFMDPDQIREAQGIIEDRYAVAEPITTEIAAKMNAWEKQYLGEWQDKEHDDAEHVFLTKTREMVQIDAAFLIQLVTQLPQLVTFKPKAKTLAGLKEDWNKAKLKECWTNFYLDDVGKFRTDVLPRFLKTFLKHTVGLIEVQYHEDNYQPDLRFEVVDRALEYLDPDARDCRELKWRIRKEYMTRAKVEQRFDQSHWERPADMPDFVPTLNRSQIDAGLLERYFGRRNRSAVSVEEDELVEILHYWQAPKDGLEHVYGVIVGGVGGYLVRYGPNPFAYKGIPLRGKSYDQHEWQLDGTPLVEIYRAIQEVTNTLVNLRLDDVRQNLQAPYVLPEQFVNATTQDDYQKRNKFIRFAAEMMEAAMKDPQFDMRRYLMKLETNLSTQGLFQDMQFWLGQGKEQAHQGDVFRGQMPQKQATWGEVQEVLTRNMGVFRPIFMQLMALVEEISEIAGAYFEDPKFFGEERLMMLTGPTPYDGMLGGYDFEQGQTKVKRVTPDQMDVDVMISAQNGADAVLQRTLLITSLQQLLASIGQIPGFFAEIQDRFKWGDIINEIAFSGWKNPEMYMRSPAEEKQHKEERAKQAQAALQAQTQAEIQAEQAKAQGKAGGQVTIDQNKAMLDSKLSSQDQQEELESITAMESGKHAAKSQQMMQEFINEMRMENQRAVNELRQQSQEHMQEMQRMVLEAGLEIKAAKEAGTNVSIAHGGNRVNKPASSPAQ